MINIDKNTPLGALTVGQLLEILAQIQKEEKPKEEVKVEIKEDRILINEVKEITGLSLSQLYKLTYKNAIPFRKFGKQLIFSRLKINEWVEKNTNEVESSVQRVSRQLAASAMKRARNSH